MPTCRNCNDIFPNWIVLDGKGHNLCNRKFCLICSPFGEHNTKTTLKSIEGKKICPKCNQIKNLDEFYYTKLKPTGHCKNCLNTSVVVRQQNYKKQCVEYKGGKCEFCGYNRYYGALEFHHKDPSKKDFSIADLRHVTFNEQTIKELDKCLMLCATCHREEHARLKGLL